MITFDPDFIKKWTGQPVNFDGIYPNQCMDLMHFYCTEVLGIEDRTVLAAPTAALVIQNFKPEWNKYFTFVKNGLLNAPAKGDIVFFSGKVNQYKDEKGNWIDGAGHVCIAVDGSMMSFNSFDANWPTGSLPHIQNHKYTNCMGWLHPVLDVTTDLKKQVDDLTKQVQMLWDVIKRAREVLA